MALPAASAFTGAGIQEGDFKTAMTDLIEYLEDLETTPVGAVVAFAMSTAPAGFLKANGALVSRTTYAALFAAIGTTFGAGDGTTTFKLPDLRGEFLRGWDDSRGVDSGRVFGTAQADELKAHTHSITVRGTVLSGGSENPPTDATGTQFGYDTSSTGGVETRPRNVSVLYCIKY